MRRHVTEPEPAVALLRRLGWRSRRAVPCRDSEGRRAAIQVRRRSPLVLEVETPGGELSLLTNVEAGSLRAALREALLD